MTVALVQKKGSGLQSGPTNSLTMDASVTANNLLVWVAVKRLTNVDSPNYPTCTPSGFTLTDGWRMWNDGSSRHGGACAWKIATGSEGTSFSGSWSGGSDPCEAFLYEFSATGGWPGAPYDTAVYNQDAGTSASTISVTSGTLIAGRGCVFVTGGGITDGGTWSSVVGTASAPYTLDANNPMTSSSQPSHWIGYRIPAAGAPTSEALLATYGGSAGGRGARLLSFLEGIAPGESVRSQAVFLG